eukprot:15366198-Ditylum_brightwellii.AAC.2
MEGVDFHIDGVKETTKKELIMKLTNSEPRKLDIKMQNMLTMKGIHHPKGNVHQLYLHQSKGGCGLSGVEDMCNCKCAALAAYVHTSTDTLT